MRMIGDSEPGAARTAGESAEPVIKNEKARFGVPSW